MKYLIWKLKDEPEVISTLMNIFGPHFGQKVPKTRNFTNERLVGTTEITPEKEKQMFLELGGKIKIVDKEPTFNPFKE